MNISVTPEGRFKLESMLGETMTITPQELEQFVEIGKSYLDQLQRSASREAGGFSLVRTTDCRVAVDAHHTEIFLQLEADQYEETYAISLPQCELLVVRLTKEVEFLRQEAAKRKGTMQ
jgi:hypothetical protein